MCTVLKNKAISSVHSVLEHTAAAGLPAMSSLLLIEYCFPTIVTAEHVPCEVCWPLCSHKTQYILF